MRTVVIDKGFGMARRETRRGAVLGVVLVVMLVVALLGAGLLTLSSVNALEAGRSVSEAQAFWTAEAGIEHVKAMAQRVRKPFPNVPYPPSPTGYLWGSNVVSGTTSKGTYTVDVVDDPAWTNATRALKKYIIRSVGISTGGARQVIQVRTAIQNFASYMHASNWERKSDGSRIYFATGDILDGPVYVNDQLNILGSPRFLQLVSSAASSVNYRSGGDDSVFEGGLLLNATPLDISGQFTSDHVTDIKTLANAGGLPLTGDYSFTFKADGSFTYARTNSGATTFTNYLSALNGAIYVNGDAYVKGVVNGRVTLAAQDAIFVSNSIVYASAVSPNPWATNFVAAYVDDSLGLMASNKVEVMGTSAINIHAAIMVTSGDPGFGAAARYLSIGTPYIYLFGGVSQFRRGVVGQSPSNGFSKNYKFDPRFLEDAPPNFPYSMYVYSGWSQSSSR
jgi:hypothetical protein